MKQLLLIFEATWRETCSVQSELRLFPGPWELIWLCVLKVVLLVQRVLNVSHRREECLQKHTADCRATVTFKLCLNHFLNRRRKMCVRRYMLNYKIGCRGVRIFMPRTLVSAVCRVHGDIFLSIYRICVSWTGRDLHSFHRRPFRCCYKNLANIVLTGM